MTSRIVTNGLTGERIVFGDYGTEDGVDYLDFDEVCLAAGADGPPAHRHLLGDEAFEVLEGRLGVRVNGETHVLEGGDTLTVPQGAVHEWWNAGNEPVRTRGRLWNPGRFEEQLTTFFSLVNRGEVNSKGVPTPLQAAVWLAEYRDEYEASVVPGPLRWLAYHVLAPVGRALGHQPVHEYVPPSDVS